MNDEPNANDRKGGRKEAIPDETQAAMKQMRAEGKTTKDIASFYKVSPNTVTKYAPARIEDPPPKEETTPGTEEEIDELVEGQVLKQHGKHILEYAKERDADIIHAGASVEQYLKDHNLNLDLRRIPKDQVIAILKGSGGYQEMDPKLKEVFDKWISEKMDGTTPAGQAPAASGKINFEDVKEMLYLKFLMKMAGDDEKPNKDVDVLAQVRIENDKLRAEMREIMLEKRFNNIDQERETVIQQLSDLQAQVAQVKISANSPDPVVRADALSHLEALAGDIDRARSIFSKLGLGGNGGGSAVASSGDGTVDRIIRIGETLTKGLMKERPKEIHTPLPQTQQAPAEQMKPLDPAEYVNFLLTLKSRTPEQEQWLVNYGVYLEREQVKIRGTAAPPPQEEQIRAQLLQKPAWTTDEARWMNQYEKNKAQLLGQQQDAPSKEYQPPQVAPEEQPEETEVQTEEQPLDEQPEVEIGTIKKMRAAEEQRMKALDGLI